MKIEVFATATSGLNMSAGPNPFKLFDTTFTFDPSVTMYDSVQTYRGLGLTDAQIEAQVAVLPAADAYNLSPGQQFTTIVVQSSGWVRAREITAVQYVATGGIVEVEVSQIGVIQDGFNEPTTQFVNLADLSGKDTILGSDMFGDTIMGGTKSDRLFGRGGDDSLFGGNGNDLIKGGVGVDFLSGGAGEDEMRGGGGKDRLEGGGQNDLLYGDGGQDRLFGGGGNDRMWGGSGADRLIGDAGNDRMFGGSGGDRLVGGSGRDNLSGQGGGDVLLGGQGNDRLSGGTGSDSLSGGSGDDWLSAGAGVDILTGGTGDDTFVFGLDEGINEITDFTIGKDIIHIVDGALSMADLTFTTVGTVTTVVNDTTEIKLQDITQGQLTVDDFLFG